MIASTDVEYTRKTYTHFENQYDEEFVSQEGFPEVDVKP